MYNPMFVQAQIDYRLEQATRTKNLKKGRRADRVRVPFVGETVSHKRAR